MNGYWLDFINFREMVATKIIKFVYVSVAILLILSGVVQFLMNIFSNPLYAIGLFFGILLINIFWRIICELLILLFSIHQELVKIARK
ncbi:MAG: DUF4282 domain-containing protein [Nostocaceae cyanobacterium]|nr:DUF4282 domain-containing protein [Nostocaceae cyanobacterium]